MELSDVRVVPSGRLAGGVATPSRAALGGISRGRPPVPRLVFDLALRISDDLEDGRLDVSVVLVAVAGQVRVAYGVPRCA